MVGGIVPNGLTPNQGHAFNSWYNWQFPQGGASQYPDGTLSPNPPIGYGDTGVAGAPLIFTYYEETTRAYWTEDVEWEVVIRKEFTGVGIDRDYYFRYTHADGFFYAYVNAGDPPPTVNNTGDQVDCP